MRIAIAAGGTAGHVVPALAIAGALRDRGGEVEFVGGERAEAELVPAAGYPFHALRVAGLDRSNPLRALRAAALAAAALVRARRLLREIGADAPIGGGGDGAGAGGGGPGAPPPPPFPAPGPSPPGVTNPRLPPLAPPGFLAFSTPRP